MIEGETLEELDGRLVVFVQVDLYWSAGDYVGDDWRINYGKLGADMDAVFHVLQKYLRGRFRPERS